jgi:hypothetical protein
MGAEPVVVAEDDRPAWAAALALVVDRVGGTVEEAAAFLRRLEVADAARVLGPVARSALDAALARSAQPAPPILDPRQDEEAG